MLYAWLTGNAFSCKMSETKFKVVVNSGEPCLPVFRVDTESTVNSGICYLSVILDTVKDSREYLSTVQSSVLAKSHKMAWKGCGGALMGASITEDQCIESLIKD